MTAQEFSGDLLRLATAAMGTRFELAIVRGGRDEPTLRSAGEEAIGEIERWHQRLSRFLTSSDVARLNARRTVRVDPELASLLDLAASVWRDTQGAFDLAAASRPSAREFTHEPAFRWVQPDATVTLAPWANLDFGGIGKGWAVDRAIEVLRQSGVSAALIHGGTSSVAAMGAPPNAASWCVRLRSAGKPHDATLSDRALGVSAAAGHRGEVAASSPPPHPRPHLVDPASGRQVTGSLVDTAAVIGPSAAVCDAWSTALAVAADRGVDLSPSLPAAYESLLHGPGGWISRRGSSQIGSIHERYQST